MVIGLKKIDWLADIIYPLVLILMETFWVYPWLVWLGSFPFYAQPRPPLSLAAVFLTLAVASLGIRLFLRQKWSVDQVRVAVIGGGLVVILLVLGAEYGAGYGFPGGRWFSYIGHLLGDVFAQPDTIVIAIPALLYLWWRGINLGQMTFNFKNIYSSFLIGLTALIILIIIWQISSSSSGFTRPGVDIGLNVLAVFFFGLMGIAISHLYAMRGSMPKEEAALTSVWRWLPIMLGVIGGMVVMVFVMAGIFSPGFFISAGHFFGAIFSFLGKVFEYILVPFNYVLEGLIWLARWVIRLLRTNQPLQPGNSGNTSLQDMFPQQTPAEIPAAVVLALKWLLILAIIGLVIFFLARAVSRFRARRAEEAIEEIHESLFSWQGLGNDLRELLGMLGKNFQRRRPPQAPVFSEDESRRLDIREIYQRLLWETSRSGLARGRHETPEEFSGRLGRAMPENRDPIIRLTEMYYDVRYGEIHLLDDQITRANHMWRELHGSLRVWSGLH